MEFGVFNSFWDKHPNHLPFLNLQESKDDPGEWNLQTSITKLYFILKSHSDEDVNKGIRQLIDSDDWRPHLVASISVLSFTSIEHHVSRGGERAKTASAKVVSVINCILNRTATDSIENEEGASIAKGWAANLNRLIDQGKIRVG